MEFTITFRRTHTRATRQAYSLSLSPFSLTLFVSGEFMFMR